MYIHVHSQAKESNFILSDNYILVIISVFVFVSVNLWTQGPAFNFGLQLSLRKRVSSQLTATTENLQIHP